MRCPPLRICSTAWPCVMPAVLSPLISTSWSLTYNRKTGLSEQLTKTSEQTQPASKISHTILCRITLWEFTLLRDVLEMRSKSGDPNRGAGKKKLPERTCAYVPVFFGCEMLDLLPWAPTHRVPCYTHSPLSNWSRIQLDLYPDPHCNTAGPAGRNRKQMCTR